MKYFLVFIVAFSIVLRSNCHENTASLQLVHVFFRHGSRIPDGHEMYPNNIYKEKFLKAGYGQLTSEGKQRAYDLGKLLFKRYQHFLGSTHSPEIVFTKTTDFDRTKRSALLLLAALFPDSFPENFKEDLKWKFVPYEYKEHIYDYELRRLNTYCPAYLRELNRVLSSEDCRKILKEYKTTFEYISNHTGLKTKTLQDVVNVYQILTSEEYMNLPLPTWAKHVHPEVTHYIAAMQCVFENYNTIMKRLNGGRMLKKVIENMIFKSKGVLEPKARKIYLYSAHDNNVINILAALNLFKPHFPEYSSATIIELYHQKVTDRHSVKVLYVKDPYTTPQELYINNCGHICELEKFIEIANPHLPQNYTQECESNIPLD